MVKLATLKPKSAKAKNRLANMMDGCPVVIIEQEMGTLRFCVSKNRNWCAWVSTTNDPHWELSI